MPLLDYIKKYYNGNQASFARLTGVQPAQVTQWLEKKIHRCGSHALQSAPQARRIIRLSLCSLTIWIA